MDLRTPLAPLLLTLFVAAVGCGSSVDDGSGGGGEGGAGGSGGAGGAGGGGPEAFDLYTCDIPLACEKMTLHISVEPADAMVCAGQLLASGERGLLQTTSAPGGPTPVSFTDWIYVLGDGTAIVQGRNDCPNGSCGVPELDAHQRCDLEGYDALVANCDPLDDADPDCVWDPFGALENCQAIDEQSCESVLAFDPQGGE